MEKDFKRAFQWILNIYDEKDGKPLIPYWKFTEVTIDPMWFFDPGSAENLSFGIVLEEKERIKDVIDTLMGTKCTIVLELKDSDLTTSSETVVFKNAMLYPSGSLKLDYKTQDCLILRMNVTF